jgi:hypothetical protein
VRIGILVQTLWLDVDAHELIDLIEPSPRLIVVPRPQVILLQTGVELLPAVE